MSTQRNERGAAIILAVILVAVMSIGVSAVWKYLHVTLGEEKRMENAEAALHLAEAGLEKAVAELRVRPDGYRGEICTPLGAGRFSVEVRPGSAHAVYHIVARGEVGEGRFIRAHKTLVAELVLSPGNEVRRFHWIEEAERP